MTLFATEGVSHIAEWYVYLRKIEKGVSRVTRQAGLLITALAATIWTIAITPATARMKLGASDRGRWTRQATSNPSHFLAAHRIGRIELAVANNGTFGREYHPGEQRDSFTGQEIPLNCEYPRGSRVSYLFGGAFWIGAVVGRDTLVSVGADGWQLTYEMYPDEAPFGDMVYRSIKDPTDLARYEGAVSEQDYIAVYTDTLTDGVPPDYSGRQHRPLNIEVTQASYAWSYSYAEDFVLFDYRIKNIGSQRLEKVYMGIYVDAMICFDCMGSIQGFQDDLSGFLETYPNMYGDCEFIDTVFLAWQADNDGDLDLLFNDGQRHPCPSAVATRIVRTPADTLDVSFNWWIGNGDPQQDFGPRERPFVGQLQEDFRSFGTGGLGTPEGDVNKYYILRNREFDYDQIYTGVITQNDSTWLYPNQELADDFGDGYDTRYLLSFGPFDISSGQSLPISFAYVGGENLHRSPDNVDNLPENPEQYYANLDFSDLALNAAWASWVYDNPGVDTDGDGTIGKWRVCCADSLVDGLDTIATNPLQIDTTWVYESCDTFFYEGDGVPDFRGASPPPAPKFQLDSQAKGTIRIRFNGLRSETTQDVFSRAFDFEGYRVYIGRDDRKSSFSLIASYDVEDYNKFIWSSSRMEWELHDLPFTLEKLRCDYADSCQDESFDPLQYPRNRPLQHPDYPDSLFYFAIQDYNVSDLTASDGIHKIYPNQEYPSSLNPDSALADELTPDGNLKYFEYEFIIRDLLASVPYYVNVTAFDFGSPQSGLQSLESSVTDGAAMIYPATSNDISESGSDIVVYPNPYRGDAGYRRAGFEGRQNIDRPDDRVRAIHFSNLPARCTIRIYTLDGDLVREIEHDEIPGSGAAAHDEWNLITRNTQLVVSGLYYWTVEDDTGNVTVGKLAIIM